MLSLTRQFRFRQFIVFIFFCDFYTFLWFIILRLFLRSFYTYFYIYYASSTSRGIEETARRFLSIIQVNIARGNVGFQKGKESPFRSTAMEDGETKGWRCSYCTVDRSAAFPPSPSRTCPRRWNVEIGKRFLHFLSSAGPRRLGAPKSNSRRQDYVRKYIGR